jgi:hypothetical protein
MLQPAGHRLPAGKSATSQASSDWRKSEAFRNAWNTGDELRRLLACGHTPVVYACIGVKGSWPDISSSEGQEPFTPLHAPVKGACSRSSRTGFAPYFFASTASIACVSSAESGVVLLP